MKKFRYKVVTFETRGFCGGKVDEPRLEELLNREGSDGWELVSVTASNESYGATKVLVCTFKKEL